MRPIPRHLLPAALVLLGLVAQAAAFEVPRHVKNLGTLPEARKSAFEDKRMLVFVYAKSTLKDDDTPGKISAAICEEGKSFGEVILVEPGKESLKAAPKVVRDAIQGTFPKATPIVILADPATTKVYGSFGQEDLKTLEFRDLFREARKAHREDMVGGRIVDPAKAPPEPAATEPAPQAGTPSVPVVPPVEIWTNREGREVRARLLSREGDKFLFQLEDGRNIPVDPANLSDESRAKAAAVGKP